MHTKLIRRRPISPLFTSTLTPFTPNGDDFADRAQRLLDDAFGVALPLAGMPFMPALDVSEQPAEFTVNAELPGLAEKDVSIDFADGVLSIRGEKLEEKKDEKDKKFYVFERNFGSFQRALPFPGGIDEPNISAEFKDGVLTVHLPKVAEERAKRRPIPIVNK